MLCRNLKASRRMSDMKKALKPQASELMHTKTYVSHVLLSSIIQTVLSVLEFHQISAVALADFTAGREFHPAPKMFMNLTLW